MANVRISIDLLYFLALPSGEYATPAEGGAIFLQGGPARVIAGSHQQTTVVSMLFVSEDATDSDSLAKLRHIQVGRLMRRVNHLLRWYRAVTGLVRIIDLTRDQAGPSDS